MVASIVKTFLRKTGIFSAAKDLYGRIVYRYGRIVHRSDSEWLHRLFGRQNNVFFIQIGAHDGKTSDSVYPIATSREWRGVLVEPVPYLFERLVENYRGHDGVVCVNVALADTDGRKPFYRLRKCDDPRLPSEYDQLGSLNKETIISHRNLIYNLDDLLIEEEIDCITFNTLACLHGIREVDLIVIDTEGYDLNILRMIDLTRFHPKLIIYEQKHLSPSDKDAAIFLLKSNGYAVHRTGPNNNAAVRRR